jgi:hypothetical protein
MSKTIALSWGGGEVCGDALVGKIITKFQFHIKTGGYYGQS